MCVCMYNILWKKKIEWYRCEPIRYILITSIIYREFNLFFFLLCLFCFVFHFISTTTTTINVIHEHNNHNLFTTIIKTMYTLLITFLETKKKFLGNFSLNFWWRKIKMNTHTHLHNQKLFETLKHFSFYSKLFQSSSSVKGRHPTTTTTTTTAINQRKNFLNFDFKMSSTSHLKISKKNEKNISWHMTPVKYSWEMLMLLWLLLLVE